MSRYFEETLLTNAWVYNGRGQVASMTPDNGPSTGTTMITIDGQNLCATNALDVTSMTIAGETAAIQQQSPTQIVAEVTGPNVNRSGKVIIESLRYGTTETSGEFSFYDSSVGGMTPNNGPEAGGGQVRICAAPGGRLGTGTDITNVYFDGSAVSMVSQDATSVVVQVAEHVAGAVDVVVCSEVYGTRTETNGYTYNAAGNITSITPNNLPQRTMGIQVVIAGTNLCNGSAADVTSITLAGVPARSIDSVSATSITVTAPSLSERTGNVIVQSISHGQTIIYDGIAYVAPSITDVSPNNGPSAGGNSVTISGEWLSYNDDVTSVTLNGQPASITAQSATELTVTADAGSVGTGDVIVHSSLFGTITGKNDYTYNKAGSISSLTPSEAPLNSQRKITIYGQNLCSDAGAVESVTLAGVAASIVTYTPQSIVVTCGETTTEKTGDVVIETRYNGTMTMTDGFSYVKPVISSLSPSDGPLAGGTEVTITGTRLSLAGDVHSVKLNGVVATVKSQKSDELVVLTGAADSAGTGTVEIDSSYYGNTTKSDAYTYNPAGTISEVTPVDMPVNAEKTVIITGENLCKTTEDITVTLAGVPATVGGYSATRIEVTCGESSSVVSGDVVVSSPSCGTTTKSAAFTYLKPEITSVSPDNGPLEGGNIITIRGSGLSASNDASVTINGIMATMLTQSSDVITVRISAAATAGISDVVVQSTHYGTTTAYDGYTYNAQGVVNSVYPVVVPQHVDNVRVTLTGNNLCDGSDITAVKVAGVSASIVSKSATEVVIEAPAHAAETADIEIVSTHYGTTVKMAAFEYVASNINGIDPASGPRNGGNRVVLDGNWMSWNDDVTSVTLNGIVAEIVSQTADRITVIAGEADNVGVGDVVVQSTYFGTLTLHDGYTYNPVGAITDVSPTRMNVSGGRSVTITGTDMCDGTTNDVTVTLAGVMATIDSVSCTQIVVIAKRATGPIVGDVVVTSIKRGELVEPNDFEYVLPSNSLQPVYMLLLLQDAE
ncbi:MAG: hypothetical protein EOL87_17800 [Spartobacteria bacterium]|nr:hypothetical protein [Spartobacteria bacterium]